MRVRFAGETNTGLKRAHNEDFLYLPDEERLVMVADGMGGHACGDVASRLAVETVVEFFRATAEDREITWPFLIDRDNRHNENRLVTGVKLANLKIFESAQRDQRFRGMGTTIVAGLFSDEQLVMVHVGDSRIYRVREGQIVQVTEDHSLLNDYIKMKRISPEDADRFPHKNVIVRALGMKETVAVDVTKEAPQLGDVYLLCSDGLSGMLDDETILRAILAEPDLDRCCERLIEEANGNGGVDNITVALARIEPQ
ncbi:MAG: Stp1/IreP family PP2C-type Ser/Thr phosphatase [Deltaproteobacteria bacterium]|nr:Stp1/IreP family PP2C-type Ser/Thr phosphatase [Deltaproteobacteria bacterium]